MALPEEVPEEAAHLYALEPAEFVAARDALARQLRQAGQPGLARAITALRRPTVAAHALNRTARAEPDLVAAVERSGAELARVQRRALSGIAGADVRGAVRAHRDDVDRLLAAVEPPVGPDAEAALRQTLMALAVDDGLAAAVRRGVLSRPGSVADASAALSFGSPLSVVVDPADDVSVADDDDGAAERAATERAATERAAAERAAAERAAAAAQRLLDRRAAERVATQRRLRRSTLQAQTAQAAVADAATALEQARQRIQQAEADLAAAAAEAAAAEEDADTAQQADRRAAAAEAAARAAVDAAAQRLADVPSPPAHPGTT